MKKAIFVGYKSNEHAFNFTKGKSYTIRQGFGYEYITDDDDYDVPFNDAIDYNYDFLVSENGALPELVEEPAHLKYFINGNLVTKGYFYESLGEVNEADRLGAKVSSVKFEIKFE